MRLRRRAKPPRCAYCHADFGKEDIRCGCGGSHTECAMANGECPACGEATKPNMTMLEKERDRLEVELERVEAELNAVEGTMEELEEVGETDQLKTQLEAGLERIGLDSDEVAKTANEFFGTAFVGSTCSSCHRTYTRYPSMRTDTRCDGCWTEDTESDRPTPNGPSTSDIIFSVALLVAVIFGILVVIL